MSEMTITKETESSPTPDQPEAELRFAPSVTFGRIGIYRHINQLPTSTDRAAMTGASKRRQVRDRFEASASARGSVVLSLVRIVASFLWVCHGLLGLFGLFGGVDGHGAALSVSAGAGYWASLIEIIVGAIMFFGFATRPLALLSSGVMAYAYFTVHAPLGLFPLENMGEPAALYSWIFLLIVALGPGALSVDALLRRRSSRRG